MDYSLAHEMFDYDPIQGVVKLRQPSRGKGLGFVAKGYIKFCTKYGEVFAHQIAYLLTYGFCPNAIDHADGNGFNNRLCNLRAANASQNGANRGATTKNQLGVKGVSLCKVTGKYRASITVRGKSINLGRYFTVEEASAAYKKAAKEYFGDFARAS